LSEGLKPLVQNKFPAKVRDCFVALLVMTFHKRELLQAKQSQAIFGSDSDMLLTKDHSYT
jgi:hypothetical protein